MMREALNRALAASVYQHRIDTLAPAVQTIDSAARNLFTAQSYDIAHALYMADLSEAQKEDDDDRKAAIILAAIAAALAARIGRDAATLAPGILDAMALSIARSGLARYGIAGDVRSLAAQQWLAQHGAELVRDINETTRQGIANIIQRGIARGDDIERIARSLLLHIDEMTPVRARKIALTETAKAWTEGELAQARLMEQSGYKMVKEWLLGPFHNVWDRCDQCADCGVVPIKFRFPNGAGGPPDHPNCGCCLVTYPAPDVAQPWGTMVLGQPLNFNPFADQGDTNA